MRLFQITIPTANIFYFKVPFLILLLLLAIAPINSKASETADVITTIKPLHSLVSAVMEGTGRPLLLLQGASSPHDYQLKPSQLTKVLNAKIIFYIDEKMEFFLRRTLNILPKNVVKASITKNANIKLLDSRGSGIWAKKNKKSNAKEEQHGHEEEKHEHADTKDEKHGHEEEKHEHAEYDTHVWLSPANAVKIVTYIANELEKVYPDNKILYRQNSKKLINKLNILNAELTKTLSPLTNERFIVLHDSYQYFEDEFGLTSAGSLTLTPNIAPSVKKISTIKKLLIEQNVKCIFSEPQFPERLPRMMVEGTNVKIVKADPLGAYIDAGSNAYINLLQNLSVAFKKCLQPD